MEIIFLCGGNLILRLMSAFSWPILELPPTKKIHKQKMVADLLKKYWKVEKRQCCSLENGIGFF
jgi:hypothetical protein